MHAGAALPVLAWSGMLERGSAVPAAGTERHRDRPRALFCFDGLMRVVSAAGHFFIPDRFGIWLPPGTVCPVDLAGRVEFQSFLLHPRFCARLDMPPHPTVLRASSLIRGIGRRCLADAAGPSTRLGGAGRDRAARQPDLHLPGSGDPRLVVVMSRVLEAPREAGNLDRLAAGIGVSERTLARLFRQDTGLSWRAWRDRLRFFLALEGMQAGRNSTELAGWLGYSSTSAFVAAFRRQAGTSPSAWRQRP